MGAAMTEMAIQTQKLTRTFGNLTAVDGIDLQVTAGQFFGFLGPNGAGKSTTIKILTGLLAPTSGSMELLGVDFAANPVEVKRQIGVVPEGMGLFERLTGSEYLKFVGRMYGLDRPTTQRRSEELLDFMQLADRPKTMIADYSHGMQKKLALAAAVIHGPRILFLDEPFEGVDALAAGALKALLARMTERGTTIFLTSHVLEIVERLCSHVAIIHKGRLVAGLRWRILRNSLRKKNNRLDLIGLIFTGVFSGILVIGLSFAFYAGAYAFLSQGRLEWMALLFWGIFLFWQIFPVFVAGFGANFDFRTLLRFPLSLRAFYIIGLAYGFADFSALASVSWLLVMTAEATVAKPGVLPAMLLIVAVFMLLNATLERLIGSWLERLLARRRTRE